MKKILNYNQNIDFTAYKMYSYLLGCLSSPNQQMVYDDYIYLRSDDVEKPCIDFATNILPENETYFYKDTLRIVFNKFDLTPLILNCGCLNAIYDHLQEGFYTLCICNYNKLDIDNKPKNKVSDYILVSGIDFEKRLIYLIIIDDYLNVIKSVSFDNFVNAFIDIENDYNIRDFNFIKPKNITTPKLEDICFKIKNYIENNLNIETNKITSKKEIYKRLPNWFVSNSDIDHSVFKMLAQHKLLFKRLIMFLEENYLKTNIHSIEYNCVLKNANKLFEITYSYTGNLDDVKKLINDMMINEDTILLNLLNNLEGHN